jgi:hypothetical protein
MKSDQAQIIIIECIREAAKESGCRPSDAHRPTQGNKPGLKARNLAIRLARAHGIPVHFLAASFTLSRETNQAALREEVAV